MSHLSQSDGLTSHNRQTPPSPFVSSMSSPTSPLRHPGQSAPHPILSSTLIPRDYLGSLARSPRSVSAHATGSGSNTSPNLPSLSSQSPALPTFPQHHSEQAGDHDRKPNERRTPLGRSITDERVPRADKSTRNPPADLSIAKTRSAISGADVNGAFLSSSSTSSHSSAAKVLSTDMPRTSSIDSAISTISTPASTQKQAEHKEATIEEVRNLIATAGSTENLVQHLLRDKAQAASQNSQLWKLVDKQRALLLGLNKDLERLTKDRDRYRRKAKELAAAQANQHIDRHVSQSHSPPRTPPTDELPIQLTESHEANEVEVEPTTSKGLQSPMDMGMMPRPLHPHTQNRGKPQMPSLSTEVVQPQLAVTSPTPVTASPQSFSAKRQTALKPLDLRSSKEDKGLAELAAAEPQQSEIVRESIAAQNRGRRKTREEDDHDREVVALQQMQEQEGARSRSKKENRPPPEANEPPAHTHLSPVAEIPIVMRPTTPQAQLSVSATEDSAYFGQQSNAQPGKESNMLSPPLRSPGLPKSPRPQPAVVASIASPDSHSSLNSLPMSPRNGGFPLSPRAPKQPIPMPGNLAPILPEPQQQANPSLTLPTRSESLNTAVNEPAPLSSSETPQVYRGLMIPSLPDLLLPPNALPSVQVKVASSRLKPSRYSMLGLKPQEDTSVFSLSVFSRSNRKELWRIEKIPAALPHLDQQIRARCPDVPKLPERKLFTGHSPATLDARRMAIDQYFEDLLDTHIDEPSAMLICKFLSTDVLDPDREAASKSPNANFQPSSGGHKKTGYLTKKGKNFGGWKSRFFVVDSSELRYFESPGGAHLGTIKLLNARIGRQTSNEQAGGEDPDSESQYRHAFLILEPKRKDTNSYVRHVLCAENDTERDEWVTALLHYIEESAGSTNRTPGSGGSNADVTSNPRSLLIRTDSVDGQTDASGKASSPTLAPSQSGSASPTSSVTPPLHQGHPDWRSAHQGASLGIPANPRAGNRQSTAGQPQQKIRNLFQFRKSSHEGLNGQAVDQRNPYPPSSARSRPGYVRPVFGLSLSEAVEGCGPVGVDIMLPAVVYRCIEYLRGKNAANEEGLFRLSGSNIVIRTLKERFNTEGDVDLLGEDEYYDVHAVASLFKTYLRELPASLLTRDMHLDFLRVLELSTKQEKIVAFNTLVHRLPFANLMVLRALSEYLLEVVQNQERNKMTVKNVGIVFSPTLNIPAPVFSMFLTEFEAIFDGPGLPTAPAVTTHEPKQDDVRSPRRQMFTDVSTPGYNQNSFAQNATVQQHSSRPAYEQEYSSRTMGMAPFNPSYEQQSYVSVPEHHAPPQPMYPPPQPGHNQHQHQLPQGGYRVVAPTSDDMATTKQKRRESAMLLF